MYPSFDEIPERLSLRRRYDVGLFGIGLYIDSIAFQEQDKVVAACATTSIWSALNALDSMQVRDIPSCSEITTSAVNFIPGSNNSFPSNELSNKQILRAIDVAGLRHHSHSLKGSSAEELLELVQCYLRSGIPIILGADVYEGTRIRGGHAMTVLGCDTRAGSRALYVHDDRLGPFARAIFTQSSAVEGIRDAKFLLALQEKDDGGNWQEAKEFLALNSLIAITNKKVRLPFTLALHTCQFICDMYKVGVDQVVKAGNIPDNLDETIKSYINFEIELSEVSTLKKSVWNAEPQEMPSESLPSEGISWLSDPAERLAAFLTHGLARFQWVARFTHQGSPAFLLLIDATDIPQGDAVSAIYVQNSTRAQPIRNSVHRPR